MSFVGVATPELSDQAEYLRSGLPHDLRALARFTDSMPTGHAGCRTNSPPRHAHLVAAEYASMKQGAGYAGHRRPALSTVTNNVHRAPRPHSRLFPALPLSRIPLCEPSGDA